jgi:hypothetical protein
VAQDFLYYWFAAECRTRFIANATNRITITVSEADSAGVPAGIGRDRPGFADKQN